MYRCIDVSTISPHQPPPATMKAPPGIGKVGGNDDDHVNLLRVFQRALRGGDAIEFESTLCEMRVRKNYNVNKTFPELSGDTLLHRAVRVGNGKVVHTLLKHGANAHALNARGINAIQTALASKNLSIAKALEFATIHRRLKVRSIKKRGKSFISTLLGADPTKSKLPDRLKILGASRLAELERNAVKKVAEFGEAIILQDEKSDGFMILIKGTVAVESVASNSSNTSRLAVLYPISIFGHFGPFLSLRRTSNVVALETVTYLFVSTAAMDKLNVRWNGKLFEMLSGLEKDVSRKIKFRTQRNVKQLSTQFIDSGLCSAAVLQRRRPTLPAWTPREREEDDALRIYTGNAFNVEHVEPPKLHKVVTSEIENLSKEISSKCNMPYYVNMQSKKRQNRLDLKNRKIDRFEYRRRDRELAEKFTIFESERRAQIERQMDSIRQAARLAAKGRTLFVSSQCGSTNYFVADKTNTSQLSFRCTLQPLDPSGIDMKNMEIVNGGGAGAAAAASKRRRELQQNKKTPLVSAPPLLPPPGL